MPRSRFRAPGVERQSCVGMELLELLCAGDGLHPPMAQAGPAFGRGWSEVRIDEAPDGDPSQARQRVPEDGRATRGAEPVRPGSSVGPGDSVNFQTVVAVHLAGDADELVLGE